MKSRRTIISALTVILGMMLSTGSFARDYEDDYSYRDRNARKRLVLDYYDEVFRGSNTLLLKREIRNQYPRVNLDRFKLQRVRLVAKTKAGRGEARLRVGRSATQWETVPGNRRDFRNDAAYTFSRIGFQNPSWSDNGRWQVQLDGQFKVRRVVVVLKKLRHRDRDRDRNDDRRRRRRR